MGRSKLGRSCSRTLKMLVLLLSLLVTFVAGKSSQEGCLSKEGNMYNLLSTMTPYDDVRGDIPKLKGCKAEAFWGFFRHGTRFPHDKQIIKYANLTAFRDQVLQNHLENRGSLCRSDLEALRDWQLVAELSQNMLLTASGVEELRQLGKRLRDAFPDLLKDYDDYGKKVDIRITSKERTRQSAEALTTGLYKKHLRFDQSQIYDSLLKNEKNCPAWKVSTKNSKWKAEVEKVKNSPEMREVIRRVSRRLGFQQDLTFELLDDMYNSCGFEYSSYHDPRLAIWCTAFSKEDLKVFEFLEDVNYYYKSAFGNNYTAKLGCSLVKDMIERLSEENPKSTLYFGHSSGNRKLLTALGIGNEDTPSGDGYSSSANRSWRTSYLTPFSANVIAVRYDCKKAGYKGDKRRQVAVFANERQVRLPGCGMSCSLEDFARNFAQLVDPGFCNSDFCGLGAATRRIDLDDSWEEDDD